MEAHSNLRRSAPGHERDSSRRFDEAGDLELRPDGHSDLSGRRGGAHPRRRAPRAPQLSTKEASYVYELGMDVPKSVTDGAGRTTTYAHDDFGRNGMVDNAAVFKSRLPYRYDYDARGNVRHRTGGGTTVEYKYDGLDRLIAIEASKNAGDPSVNVALTYDAANQKGRPYSIVE